MTFIKEILETVQCDNCQDTYQDEHTGYGFWLNQEDAWDSANNDGWTMDEDNHYCEKCHHYDESDQIILNAQRTKSS